MIMILGGIAILTTLGFANNKYNKYDKYKKDLEVEMKLIDGPTVNKLFGVNDAGESRFYYIYGSITSKIKGKATLVLEIYTLTSEGTPKDFHPMRLNWISTNEKCYFLLYAGDIHPYGGLNAELGYNITYIRIK